MSKWILTILIGYMVLVGVNWSKIRGANFNLDSIGKYFLSQDIPVEVNGRRLFLSDGEIHTAAGYLYLNGSDPAGVNFQHPPLIKYLIGYSILFTNNPLIIQVIFGLLLLLIIFRLGLLVYGKVSVPFIACLFMLVDPVFKEAITQSLLDLGQSVILMTYIVVMLKKPKIYWLQGIVLGFLLTAKFWGSSIFFIGILWLYLWLTKQLKLRLYLAHLGIALLTMNLVYLPTYSYRLGNFNFVVFELKTLKYWLNHSVSSVFGASGVMFVTGYFKTWWGNYAMARDPDWWLGWPIGLMLASFSGFKEFKLRQMSPRLLLAIIPAAYLIYLGLQAPFSRYFILILPFMYLSASDLMITLFSWYNRRKR